MEVDYWGWICEGSNCPIDIFAVEESKFELSNIHFHLSEIELPQCFLNLTLKSKICGSQLRLCKTNI